ncbi:hypothetical protein AB0M41_10220 [Streptomyces sp. NPDC051896]|uniref:hypothetical protein n=1 Tax=Streptomyces sp. NPDC051896 TaxID=3155416 RepID=UPI00341936AF
MGSAVAANGDITSAVLANRDVVLTGDAVVRVPQGTHTYTGVISGEGTLRVSGTDTLVLAKDSTFTLPHSRQHQRVRIPGDNHPYVVVDRPDEPAVTVDAGATLRYGTGGTAGLIGSFPYNTPGYQQNQDNIRVAGTLRLTLMPEFAVVHRFHHTVVGAGRTIPPPTCPIPSTLRLGCRPQPWPRSRQYRAIAQQYRSVLLQKPRDGIGQ